MNPFTTIRSAVVVGMGIALMLVTVWGLRVDHLRAGYKAALSRIVVALDGATGQRTSAASAPVAIEALALVRDRYRVERNEARGVVERQSASIRAAAAETERQRSIGERNRALAIEMVRQRDQWIRRAREAETRTARRSAEAEMEECNAVLDALYRDGF